jgi:hypothetical protein
MLLALAVASFFALLALPGLALLRRVQRPLLGEGMLAAIGPAYLASLALLTPVSVLGYTLRWPIAVLSGAYVVAVVLAVVALWPDLWRALATRAWPRPGWLSVVVGVLIAGDLLLAARAGGHPAGDAHYHVGRIRSLIDHGFQSWDPFSPARAFDGAYHTNLYHALLACAGKLLGAKAFEVWAYALPWTKLLYAAAAYRLTLAATGRREAALVATVCAVVWSLSRTTLVYPNTLAPFALIPLSASFAIELVRQESRTRGLVGLALGGLCLAQMHPLYYAFLCLVLGPTLFVILGVVQRDLRALVLCGLSLSLGAPWVLYSAAHRSTGARAANLAAEAAHTLEPEAPTAELEADVEDRIEPERESIRIEDEPWRVRRSHARHQRDRNRGFVELDGGQLMLSPGGLANPHSVRVQLIAALVIALLVFPERRRGLAVLAGAVLTLLLLLHVPWLCTALVRLAGSPWIVRRIQGLFEAFGASVIAGLVAYTIAYASSAWSRHALALVLALGYGQVKGLDQGAWKRHDVIADAWNGKALQGLLRSQHRRRLLFEGRVTPGAVIATPLGRAPALPAVFDCYGLALFPQHGTHGARDMPARREALRRILHADTPLDQRLALMRRYGVRHIHVGRKTKSRPLEDAVKPVLVARERSQAGLLLTLDTAVRNQSGERASQTE